MQNAKLLSGEKSFSSNLCSLSLFEFNFWFSWFVLEIRKKDGEPYPPKGVSNRWNGIWNGTMEWTMEYTIKIRKCCFVG